MSTYTQNAIDPFKEETTDAKTDSAKCPSCGAVLTFNPENQTLRCDHCGTELDFTSRSNSERAFSELMRNASEWSIDTKVFTCKSCGAKQVISKSDIAKSCSFCGAPNIVETNDLSGIKPNAVVPFQITIQTAAQRAIAWVKRKFFAPRKFKKHLEAEDIKGVYSPAFTYDTDTISVYRGRLGEYYYVTRRVNGKTVRERRIRYFSISGTYSKFYDDILISASSNVSRQTVDKLQPFNTSASKSYANEYLFGYCASQYNKNGLECWEEAKDVIYKDVKKGILAKYSYDVVDSLTIKTDCNNITYKYLLLPVYVGHFPFKKKLYNFFVSGVNGKVTGKAPVSVGKVLGLAGVIVGVLVGIAIIVVMSGGGV